MSLQLGGYDANRMTRVLAILDSVSPLNGMVCVYPDPEALWLLVKAGMIWEAQGGDEGNVFADSLYYEWSRAGGDVRELATMLNLDITITLTP